MTWIIRHLWRVLSVKASLVALSAISVSFSWGSTESSFMI